MDPVAALAAIIGARQHAKATTITYPAWLAKLNAGAYTPKDGSTTEWGKFFAALGDAEAALAVPTPPPPAAGQVDWRGGYDPAWAGWDGAQRPGGAATIQSVKASTIPGLTDDGQLWARFMVRPGDFSSATDHKSERAQLNNFTHTDGVEGKQAWWAWSTYFDPGYDPQVTSFPLWNIYQQFQHEGFAGQAMLNFQVNAAKKQLVLSVNSGDPARPTQLNFVLDPAFKPGKRYDHLVDVYWSSDPTVGHVAVELNGKVVLGRTPLATLYQDRSQAFAIQMMYRQAHTDTAIVYQTGLRRASSRAAAVKDFPSWPAAV